MSDLNFTIIENLTRAYSRDIFLRITHQRALVVGITVTFFDLRQFFFWITLVGDSQPLGFEIYVVPLFATIHTQPP